MTWLKLTNTWFLTPYALAVTINKYSASLLHIRCDAAQPAALSPTLQAPFGDQGAMASGTLALQVNCHAYTDISA